MRIAINCRSFLNKSYTGIGRYTYELVKSLSHIDHANEYLLYAPKGFFHFPKRISFLRSPNFSFKVDCLKRGPEKMLREAHVYHAPSPEHLKPFADSTKIVVTVHDLIFKTYPEGHTHETIRTAEEQFKRIVQMADKIICCSESTLRDLKRYFSIKDGQAVVIYPGVNRDEFYLLKEEERQLAQRFLAARGVKSPFILFVGTIEPRKNLTNLLRAFELLKSRNDFSGKLVLAGMKGWLAEEALASLKEKHLQNEIQWLGFVSNKILRYLYNTAEVFVFPSFYEGFGFPIVEAMSCGAAVVASGVSSCAEIARDAAFQVDPYRPEDIAEAIKRILCDSSLKKELQIKGLKRAQHFSFRKTAQQTLAVYGEVCGKRA